MRFSLRVHPGSKQPGVGGTHDGALVVRVREPARDGRATAAACKAVAAALGLPASAVRLVHGAASRDKLVEADGDEAELRARLERLLVG